MDHIIPLACGGDNSAENLQLLCKKCHFAKTKEEHENGYVKLSQTHSSFNQQTYDIFNSSLSNVNAFVENVEPVIDKPSPKQLKRHQFHLDINKCRKNMLYYSNYEFPLFTVMDQVVPFKGILKPGRYYVETQCPFPIRGNGWYYQPMVEYLLEQGFINTQDIKCVVYAGLTIKHNYFNAFIDYLYSSMDQFAKLAVNSMIGCFKPKIRENWRTLAITTDKNEAFYHFLECKGCFIDSRDIGDKSFFQIFEQSLTSREETESPLYEMVVEMEAIELHKLSQTVKQNKGTVLDLSTDCVVCTFPKNILPFAIDEEDGVNIKGFYYDQEQTHSKYKLEQKEGRIKHERLPNQTRTLKYEHQPLEWKVIEDSGSNDFTPMVQQILDNKMSVHIDGRAGTGKSTLIKQLQAEMGERGLKYVSLAPTNKACRIINAITIHRFVRTYPPNLLKTNGIKYIFVDEISMVPEMFYKYFIILQRMYPQINFIIAGDFAQLLPVKDRVECDYKNSVALYELCKGNRIQLSKCRRADDTLFNMLLPENIQKLKRTDFNSHFTQRHICFTNEKRKAINHQMMNSVYVEKRSKNPKLTPLMLPALTYDPNSQDVVLVAGTPIIARKNDMNFDVFNNETFTIKQIQHKTGLVVVEDDDRKVEVPVTEFQGLFHPAYCITTHKSQGTTFNHPYTIHEWERFDERLKYVALSRSTNLDFINVTRPGTAKEDGYVPNEEDMFIDE